MGPFSLTVFVALLQLTTFSVALPAGESSIAARSQFYPNAPTVEAETYVKQSLSLPQKHPADNHNSTASSIAAISYSDAAAPGATTTLILKL